MQRIADFGTMKAQRSISLALILTAAVTPSATEAATSCTVSADTMAFGNYDTTSGTPTDTASTLEISCTGTSYYAVSYNITMSQGNSGSASSRYMLSGTNKLYYNIYTTSAHSTIWYTTGPGTAALYDSMSGTGTLTKTHTAYGRIPAMQSVGSGSYSDNITITVSY